MKLWMRHRSISDQYFPYFWKYLVGLIDLCSEQDSANRPLSTNGHVWSQTSHLLTLFVCRFCIIRKSANPESWTYLSCLSELRITLKAVQNKGLVLHLSFKQKQMESFPFSDCTIIDEFVWFHRQSNPAQDSPVKVLPVRRLVWHESVMHFNNLVQHARLSCPSWIASHGLFREVHWQLIHICPAIRKGGARGERRAEVIHTRKGEGD